MSFTQLSLKTEHHVQEWQVVFKSTGQLPLPSERAVQDIRRQKSFLVCLTSEGLLTKMTWAAHTKVIDAAAENLLTFEN